MTMNSPPMNAVAELLEACREILPLVQLHRDVELGGNLPDDLSAWAYPLNRLKSAMANAATVERSLARPEL